jgi:SAM-dependent methyltransferase
MSATAVRRPCQGVLQILQFNWRSYSSTAAVVAVVLLAAPFLPRLLRVALLIGVAPALFWIASSLLVSHYVYDRFPLYDLSWITRSLSRMPSRWLNIHCGFDETSTLLADLFPGAAFDVADIFDPQVMTEPSIRQAQHSERPAIAATAARPAFAATSARFDHLPFGPGAFDAAFCIFAAHELRLARQRATLFQEIARVLVPGGQLILMEHSRDVWNFIAFGPGFLHFFSQRAWRRTATQAGFLVQSELSRSPFVRVYILRRTP